MTGRAELGPVTGSGDLAARWRADAEVLRRRGASAQAEALESCASELERWERERALEMLTLQQAAQESRYSYSWLQRQIADGSIPNAGDKGRPRIRRRDLPRKATRRERSEPDIAREILGQRTG